MLSTHILSPIHPLKRVSKRSNFGNSTRYASISGALGSPKSVVIAVEGKDPETAGAYARLLGAALDLLDEAHENERYLEAMASAGDPVAAHRAMMTRGAIRKAEGQP